MSSILLCDRKCVFMYELSGCVFEIYKHHVACEKQLHMWLDYIMTTTLPDPFGHGTDDFYVCGIATE